MNDIERAIIQGATVSQFEQTQAEMKALLKQAARERHKIPARLVGGGVLAYSPTNDRYLWTDLNTDHEAFGHSVVGNAQQLQAEIERLEPELPKVGQKVRLNHMPVEIVAHADGYAIGWDHFAKRVYASKDPEDFQCKTIGD